MQCHLSEISSLRQVNLVTAEIGGRVLGVTNTDQLTYQELVATWADLVDMTMNEAIDLVDIHKAADCIYEC